MQRILIIDDMHSWNKLLAWHLMPRGFKVDCAASCEEVRSKLRNVMPDCIIMDFNLVDLEDKLRDYDEAYRRVKLAELALEEAAANRSEKQDGYKNGTEKLSDLMEALALEQQSADELVSVKGSYFQKRMEFLLAIGESPDHTAKI